MTLDDRMNQMPSDGDTVGTSCNVCGDGFTYVSGGSDWEHHTRVCKDCSEYFAELYDRKVTDIHQNWPDELRECVIDAVNDMDAFAAIPTPNQGHHGKADNFWIIDTSDGLNVDLRNISHDN